MIVRIIINGIAICIGTPDTAYSWTGLLQSPFCFKKRRIFQACPLWAKTIQLCLHFHGLSIFLKTPDRCGTQIHSKWRLNLVLSSYIDPIGDLVTSSMSNICQYILHIWYIWQCTYSVHTVLCIRQGYQQAIDIIDIVNTSRIYLSILINEIKILICTGPPQAPLMAEQVCRKFFQFRENVL